MPFKALFLCACLLGLILIVGCDSLERTRPPGDFVRSTNFSPLNTFHYQETRLTGLRGRAYQEAGLLQVSEQALTEALRARGFEAVNADGDFYAVVTWNKALSSYEERLDSVGGATDSLPQLRSGAFGDRLSLTLTIELYEAEGDVLFWRAQLPKVLDASHYTDARVAQAVVRAIQNFPQRIDKDPNLPSLE